MNVFSFVQWNKYFHSVNDEMYHSSQLSLVEWNISSFTSWKYLYHCTYKQSLFVHHASIFSYEDSHNCTDPELKDLDLISDSSALLAFWWECGSLSLINAWLIQCVLSHMACFYPGVGTLPYSKVTYVRLPRPPFSAHSLPRNSLKFCSVTQRLLPGGGDTPIFEGDLCKAPKTPFFSSLFAQKLFKILLCHPKTVCFLSFWSKIINLSPNDPIFFILILWLKKKKKHKFVQNIINFSQISIQICVNFFFFLISSPKDPFCVKSHFSPENPSLWEFYMGKDHHFTKLFKNK